MLFAQVWWPQLGYFTLISSSFYYSRISQLGLQGSCRVVVGRQVAMTLGHTSILFSGSPVYRGVRGRVFEVKRRDPVFNRGRTAPGKRCWDGHATVSSRDLHNYLTLVQLSGYSLATTVVLQSSRWLRSRISPLSQISSSESSSSEERMREKQQFYKGCVTLQRVRGSTGVVNRGVESGYVFVPGDAFNLIL